MGTRARLTPSTDEQVSVLDDRLHFKPSHSQCGADLALVVLVQLHIGVASLVLDGEPMLLLPEVCSLRSPLTPTSARHGRVTIGVGTMLPLKWPVDFRVRYVRSHTDWTIVEEGLRLDYGYTTSGMVISVGVGVSG